MLLSVSVYDGKEPLSSDHQHSLSASNPSISTDSLAWRKWNRLTGLDMLIIVAQGLTPRDHTF